mmetsp:Transcript_19385/g.45108  ORF Transcript_19385/g.45108 Transcript_19385/m.45108 type:complete len:346 (-) Transcript_19385:166-1203(-)
MIQLLTISLNLGPSIFSSVKYYTHYPMKWYLSHFPTAVSYLSSGALMSGEASPGYLPYPDVPALVQRRMPGTRIICVGRDPLDRSFSSYRYNYVQPALQRLRRKKEHAGKDDATLRETYLFGFEDMLRAELKVLKECLAPGGPGEQGAVQGWGKTKWGKDIMESRKERGLRPLIDLDSHCYGGRYSRAVPRKQWIELVEAHPEKILSLPNLHLTQAMIGRSLYVYPLEWWYELFPTEDLYFLCTEEMRDMTGESLSKVATFLGLPKFDFADIVSQGMYNVGGHKGYDEKTSWETVEQEHNSTPTEIPLSEEFKKEMLEFFEVHNERLFSVIGRRCNWETTKSNNE